MDVSRAVPVISTIDHRRVPAGKETFKVVLAGLGVNVTEASSGSGRSVMPDRLLKGRV